MTASLFCGIVWDKNPTLFRFLHLVVGYNIWGGILLFLVSILSKVATQSFALKENKSRNATADGGVSNIEYGAEEEQMVATKEGNPIGPTSVDEREEEHVHHPTLKPRAIASIGWQKLGHLTYRRTKEHRIPSR